MRGSVAAGALGVRIFFDDGVTLRGLADGTVDPDGKFDLTLAVPDDARTGVVQVCAIALGSDRRGRDIGCAAFTVLPTPPAAVIGVVNDQGGAAVVGAEIHLLTAAGAPVARATSGAGGHYSFTGLPPGDYVVDARCAGGTATSGCPSGATYFPPTDVSLTPGAAATKPLAGLSPPVGVAVVSSLGGIALPGGALSSDGPVRITSGLSGVVAHLGSLQGLGLDPLTVRFWANVDFFDESLRARTVRFQILQGTEVLASKTATATQPVSSSDPTYGFSAYVADFNVNDLPPGDLTLRITGLAGGFSVGNRDVTLHLTDLVSRWFNDMVSSPAVTITADGPDDLIYNFTGLLPQPAFDFDKPITLPFDTVLDNKVLLGIPIEEHLHTSESWNGDAKAAAKVTFLSKDFLDETRDYKGPSGGDFATSTYTLDTIHKDLFGKKCVPIPQLFYCLGFSVDPCFVCPNLSVGVWFTTHICVQGFIDFDSRISEELHVNARLSPGATVSVPIELKVDAVACSGSAKAEPAATASLPIYYDPDRSPEFGFDDPCLRIGASLDYKVKCVGITVVKGTAGLGELKYGCSSALQSPLLRPTLSDQLTIADLSPSPSVSTDGAGHALAIWIQEESTDPSQPDRRLYYSAFNGQAWSPPARLTDDRALVDEPKLAFVGPNRALAVWVQSRLTLEQALASDQPTLLGSSELYFSIWDGGTWTVPAPITDDTLLDTSPSLSGDPSGGRAVLAWLRTHADASAGQQPVGVYAATFDGTQWSAPTMIGARSTALDHGPVARIDRQGQPAAAWVRDGDGDFLTSEDRQIVLARFANGAWSEPEAVPNLPAGAHTPSLAFDLDNNPLLVFVVPPIEVETGRLGSGDGNASVLYAAYRRGDTWEVGPVGADIHAERPVVDVNADDRAIIMYRRFGDTGDVHVSGDLASAVADLHASSLQWTTGFLTADGQVNWEVAFGIDVQSGNNFVFDVKKANLAAASMSGSEHRLATHAATAAVADGDTTVANMVVPYLVDLTVAAEDIVFSDPHPLVGDSVTITANLRNAGLKASDASAPFTVGFYDGATRIGGQQMAMSVPFNASAAVSIPYQIQQGGLHTISVVVDEGNAVVESDETNNEAQATLGVPPAPRNLSGLADGLAGRLTLRWEAPDTRGIARYQVYRATTPGTDYELAGAAAATSFTDALAAPGVPYSYVVVTVDVYGVSSAFSNATTVTLPAPLACAGDCNQNNAVTVDELLTGISIALGNSLLSTCPVFDVSNDGTITIDEILTAVTNALNGCSGT